ncbi:RNA-guided endonuclease InsQ/TnpB family protein [Actinomadura kijaniata]|uniref:RNA-guided endonuclease InsQ/TnpB family protein n=1 Tax=Actinomadura kijaniata TaxID=46161 RepID=UPI00082EDD61|nr:RNA-guided endonuclease TnpB family protein [Actinomadura kijaniata]
MKLMVQVKLLPSPQQEEALAATLHACNEAANRVSVRVFETGVHARVPLQKLVYADLKAAGLAAQASLHVIRKVADAYTVGRSQVSKRLVRGRGRQRAEGKPVEFRPDAAQPFDDRCLSWWWEDRQVSIWTVRGRVRGVPFAATSEQLDMLVRYRKGESDLVCRAGKWFLVATCEVPEAALNAEPMDWIGVDRGIVNLATTSDGRNHQGAGLTRYRRRMARVRAEVQSKGTRSARRKLRRRARKEARHASCVNHRIAKEIVADAQRTGRGIAVEDLRGIRERVRLRRHQRAMLSRWPYHQIVDYLAYKARRAGVPFLVVDPAYTSQTCPRCGHVSRRNRPRRDDFRCQVCGLAGPSDHVAAVNVRQRARVAWALVNAPIADGGPEVRFAELQAHNIPS